MTPSEFIKYIYKDVSGVSPDSCISLWESQGKSSKHLKLTSIDQIDKITADYVANNQNAYFGVALRRPMLTSGQRGKLDDLRGLPGFFLDIDFDDGQEAHVSKKLPKSPDEAVAILSALPEPTAIIDSGHGWHVYWLFNQVKPLTHEDINKQAESLEYFQRAAIIHAESLGYHVDYTGDLPRVLRIPGSINFKAGKQFPVQVLESDGPRYSGPEELLHLAIPELGDLPVKAETDEISESPTEQDLARRPTNPEDLDPENLKTKLTNLKNKESQAIIAPVLLGESFAPPGARDQVLQKIASIIAYISPDGDPATLAQNILAKSLNTFDDVDLGKYTQQDRIEWAAEKISRAQEDARRDRAISEKQARQIASALIRQARSAERRDQKLGPAAQGAYTEQELEAFAKQQSCASTKDFKNRWIIQKGPQFYVYVNGDYQKPLQDSELRNSVSRDLAPAIANGYVKLEIPTQQGNSRRKTCDELMYDYGSVARTIIARLDLGHSYYDAQTQTFYEATCPIRPLEAQYNADVNTWLTLLGNTKPDKLLDWVATVTNLEQQSSSIYLQGPPGSGKSLLSQGLARLWHIGPPTELVRVLGDWTGDISKCPLIVADEQIPNSFKGQRSSAELRALIGNSGRTLTRKYAHNADLMGAIRLILSANNAEMLVFDETLSQDDLEAISGRFLHIKGDGQAVKFLNSVNTLDWVNKDIIAKHALWLRDNRQVKPGKRFMVEGSARDVSKQLATRGSIAGRVTEWLVRYLCETPTSTIAASQSSPQQKDYCRVGNGKYWVNTNAIVTFWEQYAKSKVVPSTPQVGAALRNLSLKEVRPDRKKRYFEIDIEAISLWSELNLIGDPETIQAQISISRPDTEDPTCPSTE